MKVPTRVLDIVMKLAKGEQVSENDKATVILWADEGKRKRAAGAIEHARAVIAAAEGRS